MKSHLLMPHLSQRRDLDDMNLIVQFARSMQDLNHLNKLFILTWADIRAVGPDVWTPWKGTLLSELYKRARQVLKSDSSTHEGLDQMMGQVKEKILAHFLETAEEGVARDYLGQMPHRYFLSYTPEEILAHLRQVVKVGLDHVLIEFSVIEKDNVNELLLYTTSTPGLLAKTAGVMSANDLNILEAKQHLSKAGHALVAIRFTDSHLEMIREQRRFDLFKKDMTDILEGRVKIFELIESRKKPSWLKNKQARALPARVEVDNDVSAYYTVIDIYANNRVGLLYEILSAFSQLGLYVDVSKISTKVDQAADVFYIKDIFGQKILQSDKLKKIKAEILKVAEGE